MASEVTDYLQEQAQAFVLDQLDIPLDAQADVKAGTIDERLPSRAAKMPSPFPPRPDGDPSQHHRLPQVRGR